MSLVCGIIVDKYASIGAGSVITKDVLAYVLVYGNPVFMNRSIIYVVKRQECLVFLYRFLPTGVRNIN